ncbi:MAG: hypothetical protein GY796_22085 [Chloroflexi bacterium]|nr:hypothetical protein [Chloroflexota bacterium]
MPRGVFDDLGLGKTKDIVKEFIGKTKTATGLKVFTLHPFWKKHLKQNGKLLTILRKPCVFVLMIICPNGTMLQFLQIKNFRGLFNPHS